MEHGARLTTRQNGEMIQMSPRTEMVMFAVGATNLILMALLTALMVHEKSRPAGRRAVPVTGVTLLAVASVVLTYSAYATYAA
jgi:hypothetical protein